MLEFTKILVYLTEDNILINICIVGAEGRMGRTLINQIAQNPQLQLVGAITHKNSPMLGSVIAPTILLSDNLNSVINQSDIIIDFSHPESTLNTLECASIANCAVVIGTTGFTDSQKNEISVYSNTIPVFFAANMSVGINLMYALLVTATRALGNSADIEIIEMHHRNKIDSPSGTALKMGEIIAETLHRDLKAHAIFGRLGQDGPRDQKTIGFATLRGGDVIGDHTAIFADIGERIEITHKATDRSTFAQGALRAATWLLNQPPGLYGMNHVLGFD